MDHTSLGPNAGLQLRGAISIRAGGNKIT
jgi:hypothetical protein